MALSYRADCKVCKGDGLFSSGSGGDIRCPLCFGAEASLSDKKIVDRLLTNELEGTFDEDAYDAFYREINLEMMKNPDFAMEMNRRKQVIVQESLEIQRRTAERLAGVFKA